MYKKIQLRQQKKPIIFDSNITSPIKNRNLRLQLGQSYEESSSPYSAQRISSNRLQIQSGAHTIDQKRLGRAKIQFIEMQNLKGNNKQTQPQRKQAIKMNFFRQTTRQKQRQFHQQNHQYFRMYSLMTHSALNQNKLYIKNHRQGLQKGIKQNKTSKQNEYMMTVHLQLQTQMSSSLVNYKFPVKQTYQVVPYKRQSIQFQFRQLLDPRFQFFVNQNPSNKVRLVKDNLQNLLEEGLNNQFKTTVIRTIGNLDFFDFLNLVNNKITQKKDQHIIYPNQVIQVAKQNQLFQLNSDQEQLYLRGALQVQQEQTHQRMVTCEQFDLRQTSPGIYFESLLDYALYKKYRKIQFKFLKIYDKDITINTDIRNIISSQKIYLIQIVKQLDLYIQLSIHKADLSIMKEILVQLKRKSQQFLKLLCCYTQSSILKQYNIQNYPEKIMMFIQKSIKYKREIINPPKQLIDQYPILKIWYQLPLKVFGFSREKLHSKYYQLVEAIINYQEKIKDYQMEKQLSIKRPAVKYPI